MVKQNKQINDQNSYQLKAQRKKGEQRTSKQKKKKSLSDLKEKSAKSTSKFKAKYIKRILKKIMAKEKTEKKRNLTQQRKRINE